MLKFKYKCIRLSLLRFCVITIFSVQRTRVVKNYLNSSVLSKKSRKKTRLSMRWCRSNKLTTNRVCVCVISRDRIWIPDERFDFEQIFLVFFSLLIFLFCIFKIKCDTRSVKFVHIKFISFNLKFDNNGFRYARKANSFP